MYDKKQLKALALKYGAILIIFFINRTLVAALALYAVDFKTLMEAASYDTLSYTALMLLNELISYAVPLAACFLILKNETPSVSETASYERFGGDSVILYIFAMSAASTGAYISQLIMELLNSLVGTPLPKMAFSDTMPQNAGQYIAMLVSIVIIAPVCEEIIFRKYLLFPLRKYGDFTAALISSVIFSLYHTNMDQLVYTFVFGYFLALTAIRANSVIPTTVMHIINNLIVGITSYAPSDFGNESVNAVFSFLKASLGMILTGLSFAGLLLIIPLSLQKALRADKAPGCELSQGKQLLVFFTSPAVIVGIVLIILLFL